jgi:DNA (cytosine-5)-methyltransferase 1
MKVSELIGDNFAGGGGASTGIFLATGRHPDFAINHDAMALAAHAANHPETKHFASNIWQVDPREATGGRPLGLLWASPDCKHFSKAKGGKPVEKGIRDLAWVVVHWAKLVRPRVIILENVEEFQTWGPLRHGCAVRLRLTALRRCAARLEAHRTASACRWRAPSHRSSLDQSCMRGAARRSALAANAV